MHYLHEDCREAVQNRPPRASTEPSSLRLTMLINRSGLQMLPGTDPRTHPIILIQEVQFVIIGIAESHIVIVRS